MPKTKQPRAYTAKEARQIFLKYVQAQVNFWVNESRAKTDREKCEGVAFSIMVILDGEAGFHPALDLRLAPHQDDKAYCISQNENWHEPNMLINDCELHSEYLKITASKRSKPLPKPASESKKKAKAKAKTTKKPSKRRELSGIDNLERMTRLN